jgi:hypothetical protein
VQGRRALRLAPVSLVVVRPVSLVAVRPPPPPQQQQQQVPLSVFTW